MFFNSFFVVRALPAVSRKFNESRTCRGESSLHRVQPICRLGLSFSTRLEFIRAALSGSHSAGMPLDPN